MNFSRFNVSTLAHPAPAIWPLLDMDEAPEARGPGWDSFKTLHDSASQELNGSLTAAVRNKWLDQVERFTF